MTLATKISKMARRHLAPYIVMDSFGTLQFCWSLDEATTWQPFAAPDMVIVRRTLGQKVAATWQYEIVLRQLEDMTLVAVPTLYRAS